MSSYIRLRLEADDIGERGLRIVTPSLLFSSPQGEEGILFEVAEL